MNGRFKEAYQATRSDEILSKELLVEFEEKYPNVTTETNINNILEFLKNKQ